MPDLFQKATRFYHERPGLICLLCVAAITILAFLRVVLEETPLDEKRTWRDQRALEAVESSLTPALDVALRITLTTRPVPASLGRAADGAWEGRELSLAGAA